MITLQHSDPRVVKLCKTIEALLQNCEWRNPSLYDQAKEAFFKAAVISVEQREKVRAIDIRLNDATRKILVYLSIRERNRILLECATAVVICQGEFKKEYQNPKSE